MRILIFLIVIFGFTAVNSQNYINVNQTAINVQQNNITYSNNNLGLSMIAFEISAFRNSWDNRRKREEALSKAQAQLNMVKTAYSNSDNYPDQIINGWHLVMATDNYNYCSPAKVLIENNEIKEFVVGNWSRLSRPFKVLSSIKKGKALITLDFDGNTDTLEIYFINDLEQPTVVEKPLDSGYISFWSDSRKAKSIKIWVEGKYFGELEEQFDNQPDCFTTGTMTIEVKPGIHYFKAAGRGTISWEGNFEAKENLCLSYLLNKENKKQ